MRYLYYSTANGFIPWSNSEPSVSCPEGIACLEVPDDIGDVGKLMVDLDTLTLKPLPAPDEPDGA